MTAALGINIKEVCELFDVTVIDDLDVTEYETINGEDVPVKFKTVHALGWHSEMSAGIRGGTMTGWFDSIEALENFCYLNINRFRIEAAKCNDGAPIPDASDWR